MLNLDTLPSYGTVWAFVTVTKVSFYDENELFYGESYDESHGWVDSVGDTALWDNRNYVSAILTADVNDENLRELVADALSTLGAYHDNGDGTYYGQDSINHGDDDFTYAIHFFVKHRNPNATNVFDSYTETGLVV